MGSSVILDGQPATEQAGAGFSSLHIFPSAQTPRVSAGYQQLVEASQGKEACCSWTLPKAAFLSCVCMLCCCLPADVVQLAVSLLCHPARVPQSLPSADLQLQLFLEAVPPHILKPVQEDYIRKVSSSSQNAIVREILAWKRVLLLA
jgi:hypothetical protein